MRWSICVRVSVLLPRISIAPAMPAAPSRPVSAASSAKRKLASTITVPPRVFFGSSDTRSALPRVKVCVRDSMFCGEGSNCSPALTAARPV